MALPKFYLEPRDTPDGKQPINMYFSIYGKRLQYYTGVRLDPKFYKTTDSKGNAIDRGDVNKLISDSAPYAVQIKTSLKQMALDVQNIANAARANKIPVTVPYLREELDLIHKHKDRTEPITYTFISYFEAFINGTKSGDRLIMKGKHAGKRYSDNTLKIYINTLVAVKRYLHSAKIKTLKFEDIDKNFYSRFKSFCFSPAEDKQISTFSTYIKDIKMVMKDAQQSGIYIGESYKSSSFIMPTYEADTKALSLEEIDLIHNLDLSNNRRLEKVRDLFLVGCYSALRFSNFNNLKVENISDGFIRVKQIKTGDRVTIPVMQRLQKVLDKYDGSLPPSISIFRFNLAIKDVAKLAGLTYKVEVKRSINGTMTVMERPIYEMVSSHTARRSYATIMFKLGIPSMLIMSATGHKTEESFLKYIRATNEDKAVLMAEAMKKLGL